MNTKYNSSLSWSSSDGLSPEQPQIDVIMQSFFSKLHSTAASFQVMIIIFSASILTHILEVRACYAAVEAISFEKILQYTKPFDRMM